MLEHDQSSTLEDDHMDDMRADWKTPCSSDNLCFICASHKVVSQQELAVLDTPTNQPNQRQVLSHHCWLALPYILLQ